MNRVAAANNALFALVEATFPDPAVIVMRNPDGQRALPAANFLVSMQDDNEPEVLRVLSGPVYDLKAVALLTIARKALEKDRREHQWYGVEAMRAALAVDVTLGGVVEDARLEGVEGADMDRAKWLGGGLDLSIRLLFAAPSPAG